MSIQIIIKIREIAKRYLGKILVVLDRDKSKLVLHPDRDWKNLMILFFASLSIFAIASGYLYLDINRSGFESDQISDTVPSEIDADVEKIKETMKSIVVTEVAFEKLLSGKPRMSDPSR